MAWIRTLEAKPGSGKQHPTQVVAFAKIFDAENGSPVVQIDTLGSDERQTPGKPNQTLQFGKEASRQLFNLLKQTYQFD